MALLSTADDIRIVGTAQHGQELHMLMQEVIPQVVLLDVSMPVMDGKETLLWLKKVHGKVKVLVLTEATQIGVIKSITRSLQHNPWGQAPAQMPGPLHFNCLTADQLTSTLVPQGFTPVHFDLIFLHNSAIFRLIPIQRISLA